MKDNITNNTDLYISEMESLISPSKKNLVGKNEEVQTNIVNKNMDIVGNDLSIPREDEIELKMKGYFQYARESTKGIYEFGKRALTNITTGSVKLWNDPLGTIKSTGKNIVSWSKNLGSEAYDAIQYYKENKEKIIEDVNMDMEKASTWINKLADGATDITDTLVGAAGLFGEKISNVFGTGGIIRALSDAYKKYEDGVSETSFGGLMEDSWAGTSNSFLNYFSKNYGAVKILNSTPLDPGDGRSSLYGSIVLGAPYLFNQYADPNNRTLINTLIKDGKFLSLTPGMPKYNGLTSYIGKINNSILKQTDTPNEMLSYLKINGIDRIFAEKDKRYYTFETKYDDYFAYLETMLNALWIKMGLAKNGDSFNLYSFFEIQSENGINASGKSNLKPRYESSIGFFTNAVGSVSESIDNQTTSLGSELSNKSNDESLKFQRLNYITGMGTASGTKNLARLGGVTTNVVSNVKETLGEIFGGTIDKVSTKSTLAGKMATLAVGVAKDVINFQNMNDIGSVIQSFATSNGMKVVYPELWADSAYSKNINFNFTFTSPYGDPLSIFKYVYVPFCALACFALPRQAAENGYVSPFFVRADIPGVITSDLALVSSLTWSKSAWTKDSLPRTIECSITITDLYPYLSMTKRLSFLSANPSYAVFLDNLTGMCASSDQNSEDVLNDYFREMINRVNGQEVKGSLWNKFNSIKSSEIEKVSNMSRDSVSGTISKHSIPWIHDSSL